MTPCAEGGPGHPLDRPSIAIARGRLYGTGVIPGHDVRASPSTATA